MENLSHGKKERVEQMFDSIAPTYDLLNHLLSLGIDRLWRRRMVKMAFAAQNNASRILDVATGTGDVAIALARKIPEAHITGIDISEQMLAEGRRKVAGMNPTVKTAGKYSADISSHRGLTLSKRIVLQAGDAEKLEFGDGEFDLVTVAFGVRNFGDVETGLREMQRVLRPGGSCLVLEFSEPHGVIFGNIYRFYFHKVLPLAGRLVSRDKGAYGYLPRSVAGFPSPERFAAMLKEAGFSSIRTRKLTGGVAYIYEAKK